MGVNGTIQITGSGHRDGGHQHVATWLSLNLGLIKQKVHCLVYKVTCYTAKAILSYFALLLKNFV